MRQDPGHRWIVDRVPTAADWKNYFGMVAVSCRGKNSPSVWQPVMWDCVHLGTPWAPCNAVPRTPFDPTTLDCNGWIRSRLPGKGDIDGDGEVKVPKFSDVWTWFKAAHIVPGQPLAPADSSPGEYQP